MIRPITTTSTRGKQLLKTALFLLGVHHHVHVVAWQREARDTDDVVDAHRHRPLPRRNDGRQTALRPLRCELAFEHRFTAQHARFGDTVL